MVPTIVTALMLTFTSVDLRNPAVHGILADLLRGARYGMSDREEAAFLIRNRNGAIFFLRWQRSDLPDRAEWRGPIPAGTVAILHTHPNWLPSPSNLDARVALKTEVPVYVITRTRISLTEGGKPVIVTSGDWSEN